MAEDSLAINRPTLAGGIYPKMQGMSDKDDKLNGSERSLVKQVLQAMIAKTLQLFPLGGKKGPVDKAGIRVLVKAIRRRRISRQRALALWKKLFPGFYKKAELYVMNKNCFMANMPRPTLAGAIYTRMKVMLDQDKSLSGTERKIGKQVLNTMIAKTLQLFPLGGKKGPVDKAGIRVLVKAIRRRRISRQRALALWGKLFPKVYNAAEARLMVAACPVPPSISKVVNAPAGTNPAQVYAGGQEVIIEIHGANLPRNKQHFDIKFLTATGVSGITYDKRSVIFSADGRKITLKIKASPSAVGGFRAVQVLDTRHSKLTGLKKDALKVLKRTTPPPPPNDICKIRPSACGL